MSFTELRGDFPILDEKIGTSPLVYLDNAATTQLPRCTIEALENHYRRDHANVHRGIHTLSERSTEQLENSRAAIAAFLGAKSTDTVIFTTGVTAGINLVARAYLEPILREGDNVVVSRFEHHSNLLPYVELCRRNHAELRFLPTDLSNLHAVIDVHTKLVAVTHVSNVTGFRMPIEEIIDAAHKVGSPVLVDGAQAAKELPIDVCALDVDFYAVSAHKVFAPTGTGALYVKAARLEQMRPVTFGGGMIADLTKRLEPIYEPSQLRFEAGTPNIADIIAWKASLGYMDQIGRDNLYRREHEISDYLYTQLKGVDKITILGENPHHMGCTSFSVQGLHPYDVAVLLDKRGIALRSGHHCAITTHREFGVEFSLRASTAFYNTEEEIDYFISVLRQVIARLC